MRRGTKDEGQITKDELREANDEENLPLAPSGRGNCSDGKRGINIPPTPFKGGDATERMQEIKAVEVDNILLFTYYAIADNLQRGNCSDGKRGINIPLFTYSALADFLQRGRCDGGRRTRDEKTSP
ncbi:hypothetical protein RCZ04_22260 [Capnocytophaga sp. HP1101]